LVVTLEPGGASSARDGIVLDETIPSARELRRVLAKFIGQPLAATTFPAIAETIVRHFERHDRPVVEVIFPEQDITDGVLRVELLMGRFGMVSISGGEHWDVPSLRGQVVLPEFVSESAILSELDWLNENRLRGAMVSVSEGAQGETDVEFSLSDKRTWRTFTGYENSGVYLLGEDRFFLGLEVGDLFQRGHQLTYRLFTDDSLERYRAHALGYRFPVPNFRHVLSVTAAIIDSSVDLENAGGPSRSEGRSWLAAISYKVPLQRYQNLKHSMTMGFEFKASNNNFEFGGGEQLETPTEVAQVRVAYDAEISTVGTYSTIDVDLIWSPGELSARNSDEAFGELRPGADSEYFVVTAGIETSRQLTAGFDISFEARGQWSGGTALIPSTARRK
jgi:hemolysin activation/secretion protein